MTMKGNWPPLRRNLFPAVLILFSLVAPASAEQQGNETVCIQCHGALPGKLGEPVALWKQSIHAENGISCDGCHGGQPRDAANAMNRAMGFLGKPSEGEIPAFCGRCHVGVMKDFLASAHGRALGRGGPTCVTCHSNHKVVKATIALINEKDCSRCHSFERASIIRDAMQRTEGRVVAIDARISEFKGEGVDTEALEKGLFAVRNRFHSLFHEVNVEKVRSDSAQINTELDKFQREIAVIDQTKKKRKLAGGIAVGAALAIAGLFHLFRKTFE
ncbi:cytochrome c3 family protein [Geomonas sp. RF6]|uniref:cytochrome c3 family protein n=1 Tax=Geomonas sp. RF6 TaxID=2897342 RepID=UPI001E4DAA3C|nr:cytochrome c3 family protein [Geomonas sp. RF6]UFS71076.1 cytochrome c3 family protein [Geomonas sp. RF6]